MPTFNRDPFDPQKTNVTRKSFKFHGREYSVGDVFDWRKTACSERKARLLYEGGFLTRQEEGAEEEEPVASMEEKPKKKRYKKRMTKTSSGSNEDEIESFVREQS